LQRSASDKRCFRLRGKHPGKSSLRATLTTFAFGCLLCLLSAVAISAEFMISDVNTTLRDKVYYLDARIEYALSDKALEALHKGVPITIMLDIEIDRNREYLWDESVTELEQRYQLEYHALSKQYIVHNLNSGSRHSFPSLNVALSVLGTIVDLPLLDKNLLEPGQQYTARMRAVLDINTLPVPLRLLAYLTSGWDLSSEWYTWSFQD